MWAWRLVTLALVLLGGGLAWLSWQLHSVAPPSADSAPSPDPPVSVAPPVDVPAPSADAPPVASIPYANAPVSQAFESPVDTAAAIAPGANLYALAGTWRDADGTRFALSSLQGRPAVFTFAYTGCRELCPIVLDTLERALAQLPEADRSRARHLLIAIDPARDTPQAMRTYRAALGLDPDRWRLITGPAEAIRTLADQVDFRYRPVGAGFVHNAVVAVADASGRITARFSEGLTRPRWLARGIAQGLGP